MRDAAAGATASGETAGANGGALMRSIIQRIATGPELSKDITRDEARRGMRLVLDGAVDPVRAAVFLIALRMKRETDDENLGILDAVLETTTTVTAPADEVVDLSDPYNGFNRNLPVSVFLPAVLAACGVPAISHGVESMGPKFGATHHRVLAACGAPVASTPARGGRPPCRPRGGVGVLRSVRLQSEAARARGAAVAHRQASSAGHRRGDGGTRARPAANPRGHRLRAQALRTNLHGAGTVRGLRFSADRARHRGRHHPVAAPGREGVDLPRRRRRARGGHLARGALGIEQTVRAVPLPEGVAGYRRKSDDTGGEVDGLAIARAAARAGLDALDGVPGPARDSLVYGATLVLRHTGKTERLDDGAALVRATLDDGRARARFNGR